MAFEFFFCNLQLNSLIAANVGVTEDVNRQGAWLFAFVRGETLLQ